MWLRAHVCFAVPARDASVSFREEEADVAAVERGHGALAFGFNDCRSLLPLLPVIAF